MAQFGLTAFFCCSMMPQGPPSTTSGSDASDSSWIDVVSRQPQAADLDQLSVATVCTLPSSQAPGNPPPVTGVTGGDPGEIMWELLDLPATGGYMMGSPIRLGSICTNLMTEKWACERLPWTFEKVFWCEKDKFARKFIQDNVEPGVPDFHCCQTDEFLTNAPPCDLLLGGFSAYQPFSIMGRGDGLEDKQNRDSVVCGILRYVKIQKPVIVVLENVAGLVSRHVGS